MKKLIAILLACLVVLGLVACGAKKEEPKEESKTNLSIIMEEDDNMINTYTLIAVNPDAPWVDADGNATTNQRTVNTAGADAFIKWMLSNEGKDAIAKFGVEDYGDALFYLLDDADTPEYSGKIAEATEDTKLIHMSTTTSVNDSGLLQYLEPLFEGAYGYDLEWESAGTGKAIASAQAGNADLIFVHAKSQEEEFVSKGFARVVDGFATERLSFMYNFFVLCGPKDAKGFDELDVKAAFKKIADEKLPFVSRGDKSGTHTKELSLWPEELGITDEATTFEAYQDWYISANAGMGVCLSMANEKGAFILSDKATFLTFEANGGIIQ